MHPGGRGGKSASRGSASTAGGGEEDRPSSPELGKREVRILLECFLLKLPIEMGKYRGF